MSEINCNNCAISDFKESLCERCAEMKRIGKAEDIEELLIKAFSEVNSPAKSDCISRQSAIDLVKDVCDAIMSGCGSHYDEETGDEVFDDILEVDAILKCNKEVRIALKHMPSAQPDRALIEQLRWERDTAIQQLKELGYGLGEKPRTDGDTISRRSAIDAIEHRLAEPAYQHTGEDWYGGMNCAESELYDLPSAQPDNEMIHLQKEQAYLQGWEEGREALRKEMWEDEQDRLD